MGGGEGIRGSGQGEGRGDWGEEGFGFGRPTAFAGRMRAVPRIVLQQGMEGRRPQFTAPCKVESRALEK